MFIYLSKKIAIPNQVALRSLSWNTAHGWIACGGDTGLLKVLKLESQPKDDKTRGVAAPSNLSMNQTLEGHAGAVRVVTWNNQFQKLTTSDENGLIIVWMLHKKMWFEEMINNRNKSVVTDMRWTGDGSKICIVYRDGAVIVGSVDGNRLWGSEVGTNLKLVAWSPDSRNILFVTEEDEVWIFDAHGNKMAKLPLWAIEDIGGHVSIIGMDYFNAAGGYMDPATPSLAIAFENGRVQIMRAVYDDEPVLIDTGLALSHCKWNQEGDVLALAGTHGESGAGGRAVSQVQFYSPFGQHLRTLKVPGSSISAFTWEGSGLRVALAVDSFIYFANIRPDYKWGSFGNTVVYAYNRRDRPEQCVVFWDTNTDERYTKFVKNLLSIHAAGENCVLATRADDNTGQHILILCNAIGSPVDSKYIDIQPKHVTMTPYHIIAASDDQIYVWHYRSSVSKLTSVDSSGSLRRREGRERVFHIDDTSSSAAGGAHRPTADAIAAISASQRYLVVGRESGALHRYTLPHISLDAKYTLRCRPAQLHLNCDSSKLGIIDIGGMLSFFDFDARGTAADGRSVKGEHLAFERKDAWSLKWAEDNPALFAVMEKTRMYIFRGTDPEEPVLSSGYLCSFKDLTVRSVMLDEVMEDPTRPDKGMVVEYEARSLRDARHLLAANSIGDASSFIEDNPHPRLWRLLAETALERQDFGSAEKAFVMLQDYQGIQFVKRLKSTENKARAAAEVATYFQRFDEAEGLYREMDRMDLAVELRMRLGDWFKVVQLLQSGAGDDDALTLAWNRIGDYYADRQKWAKAAQYYTQAKNMGALVECLYILEDYEGLEALVETLPEGSPLLSNIGRKLQSVGLNDAAVAALLRAGDVKGAVDSCVLLNQWDKAVELAQAHDLPQIETLLSKYASHLLESDSTFQAIELYRKANRSTESAKLLARLAGEAAKTRANPLRAKKLYVLAALEVERFRKRNLDMTGASSMATTVATATGTMTGTAAVTAATLDTLLAQDATAGGVGDVGAASRTLDSAWHGAEAFHWFMLAQRQLRGGLMEPAMKTAMLLVNYEDILAPADIYSLIALCAYYARYYGMCSKAFMRLEALDDVEPSVREAYEGLAMDIFTQNPPRDPSGAADLTLDVEHKPRDVCLVSGRKVTDGRYYRCSTCKHKIMKTELQGLSVCPLCHAGIV